MNPARHHKNPYHPDVALFLVLIPFISAFNYYLTYTNIRMSWFLVITFVIDTVQGYAAWWVVRRIIFFLDKRLPFEAGITKRVAVQLATTITAGLLVLIVLTELTSWIARGRPAALNFYTTDLFIISIWFFVINGIYIGLFFYRQWRALAWERVQQQREQQDGLMVRQGKEALKLPFETIAAFVVDGEYVMAYQRAGRKFVIDHSLDKLEKELPGSFFRLNRQFIVHRQAVQGFRRIENGKLEVMVHEGDGLPAAITVSRTKAGAFKGWFRPE